MLRFVICIFLSQMIVQAQGLECLDCTDVVLNTESLSSYERAFLGSFESHYRNPQCKRVETAYESTGVTLKTCSDDPKPGEEARCGRLVGSIKISIDTLLKKIDIPLIHIVKRGCFLVEKTTQAGCYKETRYLAQQRGLLWATLKGIESLNIGGFRGQLCVKGRNNGAMNSAMNGANNLDYGEIDYNNIGMYYFNTGRVVQYSYSLIMLVFIIAFNIY